MDVLWLASAESRRARNFLNGICSCLCSYGLESDCHVRGEDWWSSCRIAQNNLLVDLKG
jgi:hypothetical protein